MRKLIPRVAFYTVRIRRWFVEIMSVGVLLINKIRGRLCAAFRDGKCQPCQVNQDLNFHV